MKGIILGVPLAAVLIAVLGAMAGTGPAMSRNRPERAVLRRRPPATDETGHEKGDQNDLRHQTTRRL